MTKSKLKPGSGGGPTPYTKRLYAKATYEKGKAFLFAAILLKGHANSEAQEYVLRHLLCQGVELISKAALLLIDYDKYEPFMEKYFRHDIRRVADEALVAAKQKPLSPLIAKELGELSRFYSQHRLRYSGLHDIFFNPNSLPYELVLIRVGVSVRLIRRRIARDVIPMEPKNG